MIAISPTMRILVAVEPADFRRGIDGIAALCRERLEQDPLSGSLFVFRNRRGTAIKILFYDGQGFWLCQKYLEAEGTQIFGFTGVEDHAHNRFVGAIEAGRLV